MPLAAVGRSLGALRHAVVTDDGRNAQSVIAEYLRSALGLRQAVPFDLPPLGDRRVVAPERQRQDLARIGQALEPLDRDESVHLFERRPQRRGDVEIFLAALLFWPHFEDHGVHQLSSTAAMQSISMSNGPNHAGTLTKMRAGGSVGK